MSSLIVEIVKVLEVKKHPNADRLDLVSVKGWQVVAQKDTYKVGDLVIYCPIDAVLPGALSDAMDVTKYLSNQRVKTAKLRGEYSQGLLIPLHYLPVNMQDHIELVFEGVDVADILGITKYEPKINMAGQVEKYHPDFFKYTNIENIKNFPNVLQPGERVIITEKLHGTNFRVGCIGGEFMVGSHNWGLKEVESNLYWKAARMYPKIPNASHMTLEQLLKEFYDQTGKNIILYGEIYGKGIQKGLDYGLKEFRVAFFDMCINGKYVPDTSFNSWMQVAGLPVVPLLYKGPWDWEKCRGLAEGKSSMADHIKEGFVVRPYEEREQRGVGRVIFKHISEAYLMKDYGDDH